MALKMSTLFKVKGVINQLFKHEIWRDTQGPMQMKVAWAVLAYGNEVHEGRLIAAEMRIIRRIADNTLQDD